MNSLRRSLLAWLAAGAALLLPAAVRAQDQVTPVELSTGRAFPITTRAAISRVSVASPDVADVVVTSDRDLVINAKTMGETDAIVWLTDGNRLHYRVRVRSTADRMQIVLYVKFAEIRRNALRDLGLSFLYHDGNTRAGSGAYADPNLVPPNGVVPGSSTPTSDFTTVVSNLGTDRLLAAIQAEEQKGNARTLAEPNIMAANNEWASFLAGGEIPVPMAQSAPVNGFQTVTVAFREFGVRMRFLGEILNDSLIRVRDSLEVSDLDYSNAVTVSGFRIPALRTRRVESTLDVRQNQSLVISGMFDSSDQRTKTGIPYLMNLPILGSLFSSTNFQHDESELVIVVTPVVVDPMHPRMQDTVRVAPDTMIPARSALQRKKPGVSDQAPLGIHHSTRN